jgi:FeS assembly SUF system protein
MTERTVQFQTQAGAKPELPAFPADATLEQKAIAMLRTIFDPEIPVNIYDLGLIYRLDVSDPSQVKLDMTLTSPHCPVAESLPAQVRCAIESLPEIGNVCVNLVWDPPWSQERMSEDAKLLLDMF